MKDSQTTDILFNKIIIKQNKKGYRFSVDSVILADFVYESDKEQIYLEVGTGSGVIPLILNHFDKNNKIKKIYAVEIQKSLYELAVENITINKSEKIEVLNRDIKEIKKIVPSGIMDIVFSNPPFFENSRGRRNPNEEKYIARHEVFLNFEEFVKISNYLLKYGGKLKFIYPVKNLARTLSLLNHRSFGISKMRFIYPKKGSNAKLLLIEAVKGKKFIETEILPPVYINKNDTEYSEFVNNILNY